MRNATAAGDYVWPCRHSCQLKGKNGLSSFAAPPPHPPPPPVLLLRLRLRLDQIDTMSSVLFCLLPVQPVCSFQFVLATG